MSASIRALPMATRGRTLVLSGGTHLVVAATAAARTGGARMEGGTGRR